MLDTETLEPPNALSEPHMNVHLPSTNPRINTQLSVCLCLPYVALLPHVRNTDDGANLNIV